MPSPRRGTARAAGGVSRAARTPGRGLRALAVVCSLLAAGCGMYEDEPSEVEAAVLTRGDAREGRERIREYGCHACHTIPGVRGADRTVGPPLTGIASRMYVAGLLPNTPENLVRWIRNPPEVDPRTAMPNVGVTEGDARDIAAYLYTIP